VLGQNFQELPVLLQEGIMPGSIDVGEMTARKHVPNTLDLFGAEHPIAVAIDSMDPGAVLPDQSDIVLFQHAHDARFVAKFVVEKMASDLLFKIEKPFAIIERCELVGKSTVFRIQQ
jgi:hypothetical protein